MAFEGGVFIDVLTRLNMASVDKVLKDVKLMMKEAGTTDGDAFTKSLNSSIAAGAKTTFDPLVAASDAAFRQMQIGMADLQTAEARINDLRARNYKSATDQMIAAQGQLDAAISNSQRLMADASISNARYRDSLAPVPAVGRGAADERTPSAGNDRDTATRPDVAPSTRLEDDAAAGGGAGVMGRVMSGTGRGLQAAGLGSLLGLAGMTGYGVRSSARIQDNLQQLRSLQGESDQNMAMMTPAVWRQAIETGINTNDVSKLYPQVERATNPNTGGRYRGQDAIDVVNTALQLSKVANIDPDTALQGLTTSMANYRTGPSGATGMANVIAQGLGGFKGSATDYFEAQHSIEPIAEMTGIKAPEVFAALDIESQRGQGAQQSAQNTANLIKNLAAPTSVQSSALQQFGINPQDLSTQLSENGIGGTISQILQKITADQFGPNGSIVLGAMANKPLLEQQQQTIAEKLSPEAQKYVKSDDFQKSLVSGFSARKILQKAGSENFATSDMPLLQSWLQDQQKLMGESDVLKRNQPMEQNLYGAFSSAFGGKDAARAAVMLGGSPEALGAYQKQTQQLSGAQDDPNSFTQAFKQAMDTDVNKWHQLGQSLGNLSGKIGDDLLPTIAKVTDGFTGVLDFLDKHKTAEQALIDGMLGLAGVYAANKLGAGKVAGAAYRGVKGLMGKGDGEDAATGGAASGEALQAASETLETAATTLETGATTFESAVTIFSEAAPIFGEAVPIFGEAVPIFSEAATAFAGGAAPFETGAATLETAATAMETTATTMETAATQLETAATALDGAATGLDAADLGAARGAGGLGGTGLLATAGNYAGPLILGTQVTQSIYDQYKQDGNYVNPNSSGLTGGGGQFPVAPSIPGGGGDFAQRQRQGAAPVDPTRGMLTPPPGYWQGGIADGQPLMNVADTGGDSVLGMLPDGSPVGLRGGEGILTPETVQALGGEDAVNQLNKNPWANPLKAGAKMYDSFAKGVAKYSPYGKYLVANSQSITSLEKEHEKAQKEQQKQDNSLADFMINYYDDAYAAQGLKYSGQNRAYTLGGYYSFQKNGNDRFHPDKTGDYASGGGGRGGDPNTMHAIAQAASAMGLDQTQYNDVKWIFSHESSFDPTISNGGGHGAPSNNKAYGLGQFLGHMGDKYDQMGAYSGDPAAETQAAVQYMIDRYGSPAGAKAYWETHGNYAKGGVVGYSGGGIVVPQGDAGILYGTSPGPASDPRGQQRLGGAGPGGLPNFQTGSLPDWWSSLIADGKTGLTPNWWMKPWEVPPPAFGRSPDEPPTGDNGGPWSNPNGSTNDPSPEDPKFFPPGADGGPFGVMPGSKGASGSAFHFSNGGIVPLTPPGSSNGPHGPGDPTGGLLTPPTSPAKPAPAKQGDFGPFGTNNLPGMPGVKGPKKPSSHSRKSSAHGDVPTAFVIPGGTAPTGDRNIQDNSSKQLTAEGKGFGVGGGLLGAAESAATMAANAFAPGSGQAAQSLFDLANLGIGYAGKLVGIGWEGLMETALPNDSPAADPSKNIFGKMALGLAGAHPSGDNLAGAHAKALEPKKDLDAGSMQAKQQPGIHVGEIHNHTGDHSETFSAINKAVNFANHSGTFAGQ